MVYVISVLLSVVNIVESSKVVCHFQQFSSAHCDTDNSTNANNNHHRNYNTCIAIVF